MSSFVFFFLTMFLYNKIFCIRVMKALSLPIVYYFIYGAIIIGGIITAGTKNHAFVNNDTCDSFWTDLTLQRFITYTYCVLFLYVIYTVLVAIPKEFFFRFGVVLTIHVVQFSLVISYLSNDVARCWTISTPIYVLINIIRVVIVLDLAKNWALVYNHLYKLTGEKKEVDIGAHDDTSSLLDVDIKKEEVPVEEIQQEEKEKNSLFSITNTTRNEFPRLLF